MTFFGSFAHIIGHLLTEWWLLERQMAPGKTGPGSCGIGIPTCSSCERIPTTKATEKQTENTSTSFPREGGIKVLTGPILCKWPGKLNWLRLNVETKCHFGKICKKTSKVLSVHQAKNTACKRLAAQKQRTKDPLGASQKDDSHETHHSTNDLNTPVQTADSSETASASQTD